MLEKAFIYVMRPEIEQGSRDDVYRKGLLSVLYE